MKNPQPKFPECRAFVVLPGNISDSAATALMDISPTNQSPGASDWAWGDLSPGQMLAWASCVHTGTFPCGQRSLFNGSMHYNGRTLCKPLEKILVGVFFPASSSFISSSSPLFLHVFLCWFCFHFLFLFSLLPFFAFISSASFPSYRCLLVLLSFLLPLLFSLLPFSAFISSASFLSYLPLLVIVSFLLPLLFSLLPLRLLFSLFPPPFCSPGFLLTPHLFCISRAAGFFFFIGVMQHSKGQHKVSQLKLPMSTWRCRGCPGEGLALQHVSLCCCFTLS